MEYLKFEDFRHEPAEPEKPAEKATIEKDAGAEARKAAGDGKKASTKGSKKGKKARGDGGIVVQICDDDLKLIARLARGRKYHAAVTCWIGLNSLAFKKGNPFSASFRVLEFECHSQHDELTARLEILANGKMIKVTSGKASRKANVYELLKGSYVNHRRKGKGKEASKGEPAQGSKATSEEPPEYGYPARRHYA